MISRSGERPWSKHRRAGFLWYIIDYNYHTSLIILIWIISWLKHNYHSCPCRRIQKAIRLFENGDSEGKLQHLYFLHMMYWKECSQTYWENERSGFSLPDRWWRKVGYRSHDPWERTSYLGLHRRRCWSGRISHLRDSIACGPRKTTEEEQFLNLQL